MQNSLNTAFGGGVFTETFDERKLKITIQADSQSEVQLFADDELKASNDWQGADYDSNTLMSTNEVLGNFTTQSHTSSTFESGVIDLRRIHNIYIMSENLSTFRTLGPRGESGIIKNTCNNRFWFSIIDNVVVSHDWIDVSKQLLKTLEFRLCDAYGRVIDLRGMPISCSLIFMLQDD